MTAICKERLGVVTAQAVRFGQVETVEDFADHLLRLFRMTGIAVKVSYMMAGLVAVCILSDQAGYVGNETGVFSRAFEEEQ